MTSSNDLDYERISSCRSCGSERLSEVLALGNTPLADRLLSADNLDEPEPECPLTLVYCEDCCLLQIRETVRPDILFHADYPYFSSVSDQLMDHFRSSVEEVLERRRFGTDSLVVELASNDGYLLRHYAARDIAVLGIDPAPGPAARAIEQGIDTRVAFFTRDLAEELRAEGVAADVIHANNVLAHVADTNGFVAGMAALLKDDGEVVIECPYVKDLIEKCEFDTIYHQHLCYFSVTSVMALFERHGLHLNRVVKTAIHGGSLRLYLGKLSDPDQSVASALREERELGFTSKAVFADFGERVRAVRSALRDMLIRLRRGGHRIAGYGAAAKACTMMNYVGIDAALLDYIADRNEYKQGRFMTGNRLPIVPVENIATDKPDYLLILSWNFADEIMRQQAEFAAGGGKFIVPIPAPEIH